VVWRLLRPASGGAFVAAAAGFVAMAAMALVQQAGGGAAGGATSSAPMLALGGAAAASAMVLPGVSGGYLLLALGQYVPILASVDRLKVAASDADLGAALAEASVVVPVGIGVAVGVVVVSNVLRVLLHRHEKPTLGFLLGLLFGAVVGLWPFQQGVAPQEGDVIKGRVVTAETLAEIDAADYPVRLFSPGPAQVAGALALIAGGFAATTAIAHLGAGRRRRADPAPLAEVPDQSP
jgi:putative membrane protein